MKKIAVLGSLILGSVAMAQTTVTIGWSGAITGPTSEAGSKYAAGIEDYCKYANEKKMVANVKFNCIVKDDLYINANTQRNFEEYVDKGAAVFLGYSTSATLQLKSTINEVKIPSLMGSYHIGNVDQPNKYIFLPITSYSEQVVALLEYINKDSEGKKTKVALVVNPSPFGRAASEDAQKAAKDLGNINIVAIREVGGNNLDNTALLKELEGLGVEYVINQNTAGPVANILKDAKKLGLNKKMTFVGAHYTGGDDLINLAGDAADGFVWVTSFYTYDENVPGMKLVRELAKVGGRAENVASSVHYTSGAFAVATAIEAVKRANDRKQITGNPEKDRDAVYKALVGMNGSKAYSSGFTVNAAAFSLSDMVGADGLRLFEAKGGKFVPRGGAFTSKLFRKVHPNK